MCVCISIYTYTHRLNPRLSTFLLAQINKKKNPQPTCIFYALFILKGRIRMI